MIVFHIKIFEQQGLQLRFHALGSAESRREDIFARVFQNAIKRALIEAGQEAANAGLARPLSPALLAHLKKELGEEAGPTGMPVGAPPCFKPVGGPSFSRMVREIVESLRGAADSCRQTEGLDSARAQAYEAAIDTVEARAKVYLAAVLRWKAAAAAGATASQN